MDSVHSVSADAMSDGREREASFPAIVDNEMPHHYLEKPEPEPDTRPVAERMDALLVGMPGRRDALMAILTDCQTQRSDEEVQETVDAVQVANKSVFGAFTFCRLLEQAGALAHVLEDASPFIEEDYQPVVIEEDGVEYLQAAEPPKSFWLTTAEGIAYLQADDPAGRTRATLAAEECYLPLYKYVLSACRGEGAKTAELSAVIDEHELTQEPRMYVQHFLKQLEDAGALKWQGAWCTTPAGEDALAGLADIEDIA